MTRRCRAALALAVAAASCLALAGCDLDPRTATLPGGVATGSGGYTVTAVFSSADNLVPNADVQYQNVRIGTVRRIELDYRTWQAKVTISLQKKVVLPGNVGAALGQKSLLGAEYVQIDPPAKPAGRLADRAVIPLSRTQRYPETEEVLSAVSLLLNDGGLAQLKTITTQLNQALGGRESTARDVLKQLTTFVTRLNDQKYKIIQATRSLDKLAGELAVNRATVARALVHITPAVGTLNQDKTKLTTALAALDRLSKIASKVLDANRAGLETNLALLRPTLTKLAETGKALPDSLPIFVSFPFPVTTLDKAVKGDYMNLFVTTDLSLPVIQQDFLGSLPIVGGLPIGTILQAKNPLTAPLGSAAPKSSSVPSSTPTRSNTSSTAPSSSPPSTTAPAPSPSPTCGLIASVLGGC